MKTAPPNSSTKKREEKEFKEVFEQEIKTIRDRRKANEFDQNTDQDLFGIALSGGGIRSASFCLGALQALDQYGLVQRADYLSTVSGGGYIGASMAAAMNAKDKWDFPFTVASKSITSDKKEDVRDSEAVSHIRDYSKFLAPRGLYDIGISAAILLRGLTVNLILTLSVLFPLATAVILANPTTTELDHSVLFDLLHPLSGWIGDQRWIAIKSVIADPFIATKSTAVLLAACLVYWALYRSSQEQKATHNADASLEQESASAKTGRKLLNLLIIVSVIEVQPQIINWLITTSKPDGSWFQPIAAMAAAAVSITTLTVSFHATLVTWIQRALNISTIRTRLQAVLARAAFYAVGLVLPLAMYGLFLALVVWGITIPCTFRQCHSLSPAFFASPGWMLALAVTFLVSLLAYLFRSGGKLLGMLREFCRSYGGIALIIAILLPMLLLAALAIRGTPAVRVEWIVPANYLFISGILVIIALNFSHNANGLHRLYRDRLRTAFRLHRDDEKSLFLDKLGNQCPYLLINATLNVRRSNKTKGSSNKTQGGSSTTEGSLNTPQGSRKSRAFDPAKRGRNAEFFLFSRHYIGSDLTGYRESESISKEAPEVDLAAAVAISGAAVSSSMGRIGLGLLRPTFALLNLRLGYWLPNPSNEPPERKRWEDIFGLYLFAESFGRLRSDSSKIYITDGGHIDNIGLYQLLKRRCKFIIVIDAEADSGMNFGALCDVQRFARIDAGVHIRLDWQPLRSAALARLADRSKTVARDSQTHRKHFAVGRILYEDGHEGVLLYIKAAMTGDEPDYVLDYERRYPNFPHETTNDQFFSEEQMEAYRALGLHSVRTALEMGEFPTKAMLPYK